jgi:hypothetical protein
MKFLMATNKEVSLYHDALSLLGIPETDTTTFATTTYTRYVNAWYERLIFYIWKNSGKWQFVDRNSTTGLPEATQVLVAGTETYTIPTTAIDIREVWVKDENGNYRKLDKINPTEILGARDEYGKTDGKPEEWYLSGDKIVLKPAPAAGYITTASGLKTILDSSVTVFAITDTTKEPGFISTFHRVLSLGAAFDFARAHEMVTKINFIKPDLDLMLTQMEEYYAKRSKGDKARIKPTITSSI